MSATNQHWRISDARKMPEKGRGAGPPFDVSARKTDSGFPIAPGPGSAATSPPAIQACLQW